VSLKGTTGSKSTQLRLKNFCILPNVTQSFKLQRLDLQSWKAEAMIRLFIAEHCSTIQNIQPYKRDRQLLWVRGGARGVPGGPLPPKILPGPPSGPPKIFCVTSCHCIEVLHRPLTAPLIAKLAPPVAPPNEKVWLHPCCESYNKRGKLQLRCSKHWLKENCGPESVLAKTGVFSPCLLWVSARRKINIL